MCLYNNKWRFNCKYEICFLNYADLEKLYSDNGYKLKPNVVYVNTTNSKYTTQIKQKVNELGYSQSSQEQMASMF